MNWMTNIVRVVRAERDYRIILAAWDKETKQRIVDDQSLEGSSLIDHKKADEYDLALWENHNHEGFPLYFVSLNTGNYDPFNKENVNKKIPADKVKGLKTIVDEIVAILVQWVHRYGKIGIGSQNKEKQSQYFKILVKPLEQAGIRYELISEKFPNLGFFIF